MGQVNPAPCIHHQRLKQNLSTARRHRRRCPSAGMTPSLLNPAHQASYVNGEGSAPRGEGWCKVPISRHYSDEERQKLPALGQHAARSRKISDASHHGSSSSSVSSRQTAADVKPLPIPSELFSPLLSGNSTRSSLALTFADQNRHEPLPSPLPLSDEKSLVTARGKVRQSDPSLSGVRFLECASWGGEAGAGATTQGGSQALAVAGPEERELDGDGSLHKRREWKGDGRGLVLAGG